MLRILVSIAHEGRGSEQAPARAGVALEAGRALVELLALLAALYIPVLLKTYHELFNYCIFSLFYLWHRITSLQRIT